MGKKLKKIKLNKFWKNIFSNKPLMILVAVFILAIFFSSPTAQQYFRATGSNAAGVDLGGGTGLGGGNSIDNGVPVNLIFTPEQKLTDIPVSIYPTDIYQNQIVLINIDDNSDTNIYTYNIKTKVLNKIVSKVNLWGVPRIWGDTVVYSQVDLGGINVYKYNVSQIGSFPIALTMDGKSKDPDIYGSLVVFTKKIDNQQLDQENIYLYNLSSNQTIPINTDNSYIAAQVQPRIDKNIIVWTEYVNIFPGNPSIVWMYNMKTGVATQISASDGHIVNRETSVNLGKIAYAILHEVIGGSNADIYLYNISTGVTDHVLDSDVSEIYPEIRDNNTNNFILYEAIKQPGGFGDHSLRLYDIKNQKDYLVSNNFGNSGSSYMWLDGKSLIIVWGGKTSVDQPTQLYMRRVTIL